MKKNILDYIEIDENYKYSVNIKFDIGDFDKIDKFIPTPNNINLLKKIFISLHKDQHSRANVLSGAYGTGKSLFGMLVGTILSFKESRRYHNFLDNIGRFDQQLSTKINKEINESSRYLIVIPDTKANTFSQSMVSSLENALEREGIKNIFPDTYFDSVIKKIDDWEENFPKTYDDFKNILKNRFNLKITEFIDDINNYDRDSFDQFVDIYPEITSGSQFEKFYGVNLEEIYLSVVKEIRDKGYKGVFVLFDEFNKLLENNIKNFDSKELQDFAEMCTRTGEDEIHLLLISHKKFSQYYSEDDRETINEWKKVEKRFNFFDIGEFSNRIYDIISTTIKIDKKYKNYLKDKHNDLFESVNDRLVELNLIPDYSEDDSLEKIIYGCYPLHPITTVLLPKLSQKIAQNERTLFTFLSSKDNNSLVDILRNKTDNSDFINVYHLYDYFEKEMKEEIEYDYIHDNWRDTQIALGKINSDEKIKRYIIKTLSVIQSVKSFGIIPPSKEIMRFALNHIDEKEYNKALNELIESKIILYRKSLDQYKFFQGSDVDIKNAIKKKINERKNEFSYKHILDDYFKPEVIYPKRYNHKYKIRRYFESAFIYFNELKEVNKNHKIVEYFGESKYVDGIILYILIDNREDLKSAREYVKKEIKDKKVVLIIPNTPISIKNDLRKLDAEIILRDDEEFISQDPIVEEELEQYIDESVNTIDNKLLKVTDPKNKINVFYTNSPKHINTKKGLSNLISEICYDIYDRTPIINNEQIVKNYISSIQQSAIKSIIDKLLQNEKKTNFGIDGYGPDYLIYRTFFIKTGIIKEDKDKGVIKKEAEKIDNNLYEVLELIKSKIKQNKSVSFYEIFSTLRKPPYGIKKYVLPLLIATAIYIFDLFDKIILVERNNEIKLDSSIFIKLIHNPKNYEFEYLQYDEVVSKYVTSLENIFYDNKIENYNRINRLWEIYESYKDWYYSLDNYARSTDNISEKSILIRKILERPQISPKRLFFYILPKKLTNSDKISKNNVDQIIDHIEKYYKELNSVFEKLINRIQLDISNIFSQGNSGNLSKLLFDWYNGLDEYSVDKNYNDDITNKFLKLFKDKHLTDETSDDAAIDILSNNLLGFDTKDLNDRTVGNLTDSLKKVKEDIFTKDKNKEKEKNNFQIKILDKKGNEKRKIFKDLDTSNNHLATMLENKIRSNFNDIGNGVSSGDKQKILINLLKELI
ncbi:MAG: hypothetical protein K9K32_00525 [Halanaerobiales bacterium]|nr:hypothetical protein [Halanaerobiales bacterium]MCF8008222.1 hypothetical protein [Halanaerobiales bacterium]